MIDIGIIEPVDESEWISPMVVQENKIVEVCISVNLTKLNDAFLHGAFLNSFINEVLDRIKG